jgi:hypothetical protein
MGATTLSGAVGGTHALSSITTNAGGTLAINGGLVRTTGAQTYGELATLGANTRLRGVNVAFASTVDSVGSTPYSLTISDSGDTVLGGSVGALHALSSLTTDSLTTADGETHIKGVHIVAGSAVFYDIVKVFTDATVQTQGETTFMQTVDADVANTRTLKLNGGSNGAISVYGALGGSVAFKTLEVVNSEMTAFTGKVTTSDSVVLTDTRDNQAITFNGGLSTATLSVAAEPFNLILKGEVSVTNATTLANTGTLQLGAVALDNLYFAGGLVATAPSVITTAGVIRSNNTGITLGRANSSINLVQMTDINSGTGSLRVASPVTANAYRLRLLSTGPITWDGDLTSTGALSFAGPVTFTNSATLTAASFDFASSVAFGGVTTITANTVTFGGAVTAARALTVNGATTINGGSVNSGSHTHTYNGTVTVGGLATDTTTFTGVGMTFGSTLNGISRVLVADSGNTTYTGAIGSLVAPSHFETDAAGSSTFRGGLVRTSSPNSITIADDAVVTADTTFDTTNNGVLAAGANITFGKTFNSDAAGAHAVTLNAGTNGVVSVVGTIGNAHPLSTLTLTNSNGTTFSSAVTVDTAVVLTDTTDGQTIRFANNLSTPVLTTTANGYHLELLGTTTNVSAANTATTFLNTGSLVLGNGAADTLTFAGGLTATAPAVISAAGTINTTNTAMSLGDAGTALTLTANTTLDTAGGSLTLGGAVNGTTANTESLTLNTGSTGAVSVVGSVGQTTSLQTLTLTNSNGVVFSAPVTTGTSVVLTDTTDGQTIRFADDLSTPVLTTTANGYNLELLGTTTSVSAPATATTFLNTGNLVLGNGAGDIMTFAGGVTATAPAAISAAGTINTTNTAMSFGDAGTALTLTTNLTLATSGGNASAGGSLTLGGAVNGTTADTQSLTLNAGSTGAVSVVGAMGQGTSLKTLTLTNSNGAVFNAPVTLGTSVVLTDTTDGQTISFADNLSTPVLTTTANGYNLELLGTNTNVSAPATDTTFLNTGNLVLGNGAGDSLTFAGGLIATAHTAISAAGTISTTNAALTLGTAPIQLLGDTVFDTGTATITLGGAITGPYHLTFESPLVLNIASSMTVTSVTFEAPVTGSSLSVVGSTTMNAASVTTVGAQSYSGAMTLMSDTVLGAGASDITLGGTVNGAYALTVNTSGTTRFNGAVGGTTALASLTTNATGMASIATNTIRTTGAQTFHDMVSVMGDATFTASQMTFNAAVMGSGDLNWVGPVTLNAASVTSAGAQTYSGAVQLMRNTLIDAGSDDVTFSSTVDGAYALNIQSGGTTTLGGAVGAGTALTSLTTDAGGSVLISGGGVSTTVAQTYNDAVNLGANATLSSTGGGDIRLVDALNGAHALTVNTAGVSRFEGVVGGVGPLSSLTTDAPGSVWVSGGAVTTTGAQTYNDAVVLGANATLMSTGNTLHFVSIADGASSFNLNLKSATALVLHDVDITGNLHGTIRAGGMSQHTGTSLNLGGTSTFTADTGTHQVAALTNADNTFTGTLTLNQINDGSWADVSVTTDSALTLGALQSGGTVNLQTQGALTTTSPLSASGNLTVNSHGGAVSLGAATVTGSMSVLSGNGSVTQTGQLVVTGSTSVTAGTGTITLLNALNSFGGTLALQGTSTSVATSGNLQLATVRNTGPMVLRAPSGSIDLGSAFITGGDLTLESRGNMNLGGANITGDLNMTSTQGTVSFGQATVTGDLSATTNGRQVDLGSARVGGDLNVQTNGGNVVQSATPGSALNVVGASTINAGSGNVTLPNVPNQFGGAISLHANSVELVASSDLVLGNSTVTGNLTVTSVTGDVTQMPSSVINVSGTTDLTATQGDVLLGNTNIFTQAVTLDTTNATINTSSALTLGASRVTGNLEARVAAGDITQTGPMVVTGTSSLVATTGNITLTDTANSFGDRVSIDTPQALKLTANGPLSMGEVNVGLTTDLQSQGVLDLGTQSVYTGKLIAKSGGFDIIQSGPLKAGKDVDFDAGNAKIDLFNPKNLWLGALYFKGGVVMINHPQLLNAVNAGTLVVRVETSVVQPAKMSAPASAATTSAAEPSSTGKGVDVSVSVARPATAAQSGLVTVTVSSEAASSGKGFAFALSDHIPAEVPKTAQVAVTQLDGKALPEWLRYDVQAQKVIATSPPPGAFPIQIKANMGGVETVIVITEQPK